MWVVFDRDKKMPKDEPSKFNNAIKKAKANGIKVAYSNDAFEYWILLHFNDHQGGCMNRIEYKQKLRELLNEFGIEYNSKHKHIPDEVLQLLKDNDRRQNAIDRARRNDTWHQADNPNNPALHCSTTTVYKLVEEILRFK